jgi:hypothetical protein
MRRAAVASILVLGLARPAAATPYETFVDVDDQSDLEDLLAAGDLTQDTFDELLDLLQNGVDLNTADRATLYALPNLTYQDVDAIMAFRDKQNGVIRDPAALVTAGVLSEEKLLAISAFLVLGEREDTLNVRGWLRAMTRWSPDDSGVPPLALRGRFALGRHLQAGFAAVLTRQEIGSPVYDPNRDALIADGPGYRVHVPKIFVKYEDDEATLIGGTFRAGFGQRLVFDNTNHYTPNGLYSDDELFYSQDLVAECRQSQGELAASPCSGAAGGVYVTPDWRWRDGLFGVGAGMKKLELGAGWLQGYVWASASQRNIYQYELVDRGKCADPHADSDPDCAAPDVYVRQDNLLSPSPRWSFETLPDVFQERLAGANVTYFSDRRNSLGVTAYGADEINLVDGIDLDTQEWSRTPTGRRYGAVGGNFSVGKQAFDVFGELAYSFDRMPAPDGIVVQGPQQGGGGPAAILRTTWTQSHEELEGSLRYYSIDYANPYAHPISQPDEFDGQRARDETGARVRYYKTDKQFGLRALVDVWAPVSSLRSDSPLGRIQPELDSYVRGDMKTSDQLRLGLWLRFQDKDLLAGGHDQCFSVSTAEDENGEPIPCSGRQLTTIARARVTPDKVTAVEVLLEHQLVDDNQHSKTSFRQDVAAWVIAHYRPTPRLQLRGRVRWLDEAIDDNTYLEQSVSGTAEGVLTLRERDLLRLRVDSTLWLDDRTSTAARDQNPDLQVWLSYEARL